MKPKFFLLLLLSMVSVSFFAQRTRDSLAIIGYDDIPLRVFSEYPLTPDGKSPKIEKKIEPNSGVMCFDLCFLVKATIKNQTAFTKLYINTETGVVGYYSFDERIEDIPLSPLEVKSVFNLFFWGGASYSYSVEEDRRNGTKDYTVYTGNTDVFPESEVKDGSIFYNKREKKYFTEENLDAFKYQHSSMGDSYMYLKGSAYPQKLDGIRLLGFFGLGFMQALEGVYMSLQSETAEDEIFEVIKIDKTEMCFDTSLFKKKEDELITIERQQAQKKEKLDKEYDNKLKDTGADCKELSLKIVNQKKLILSKEQKINDILKNNNQQILMKNQTIKREFFAASDPIYKLELNELETEYKICVLRNDTSEKTSSNIACLQSKLSKIREIKRELQSVTGSEPADHLRKTKIYSKIYENNTKPCVK